jgi:hypothetical protein
MKLQERLWYRQKGRCFYCDRMMHTRRPSMGKAADGLLCTVDHIARDVAHNLTVGACLDCNGERGSLPAHEYIMVHFLRIEGRATA